MFRALLCGVAEVAAALSLVTRREGMLSRRRFVKLPRRLSGAPARTTTHGAKCQSSEDPVRNRRRWRPAARAPGRRGQSACSRVTKPMRSVWSSAVQANRPSLSGDQSKPVSGWLDRPRAARRSSAPATPRAAPLPAFADLRPGRALKRPRAWCEPLRPQFWSRPSLTALGRAGEAATYRETY